MPKERKHRVTLTRYDIALLDNGLSWLIDQAIGNTAEVRDAEQLRKRLAPYLKKGK